MDEQNQGDELYPIAVLIDELKVRFWKGSIGIESRLLTIDSTTTSSSA
jgi:hypothetical protein